MKRKAKFGVRQLVGLRDCFASYGQIAKRKLFEHGYSYELFPVTEHTASGWYDECDLRPLTRREKEGKRG